MITEKPCLWHLHCINTDNNKKNNLLKNIMRWGKPMAINFYPNREEMIKEVKR